MRRKMRKPADMTTRAYVNHIHRINYEELPHLPPFEADGNRIADDELLDIVMFGIPNSWIKEMDRQNFDPMAHTMNRLVEFCERLESAEDFSPTKADKGNKKPKGSKDYRSRGEKDGKWCDIHKSKTHDTAECSVVKRAMEKDGGNKSGGYKSKSWKRNADDNKSYTKKELNALVKKAEKAATKKAVAECNAITKKRGSDKSDDSSMGSVNLVERMEEIDKELADFDFDKVDNKFDEASC
jgi:hypothetical protein